MAARRRGWPVLGALSMLLVGCNADHDDATRSSSTAEAAVTTSASTGSSAATTSTTGAAATTASSTAPGGTGRGTVASLTRQQVDAAVSKIDGLVDAEMKRSGVPGIAVAVVYDDEVVFAKGYGVREVGTDGPVSADTVFQLASLSKPITGTALAGLVSDGTIKWDEPVHQYAPDLVFSDPWVTDHVTFADLYSHRSGLPGAIGDPSRVFGFTRDEILARLRFVPLNPFRASYAYTNFGMTAGGDAAAKAAGVPFEQMVAKQLFEPAGMTSSSASYADFLARPDRATIHAKIDGTWVPGPDARSRCAGAGGWRERLGERRRHLDAPGAQRRHPRRQADHRRGSARADAHPADREAARRRPTTARRTSTGSDGTSTRTTSATSAGRTPAPSRHGRVDQRRRCCRPSSSGVVVLTNGMPIGVPETLADQIIDQIVTGGQTQDWPDLWQATSAPSSTQDPALSTRAGAATPARPLDAYLGSYANDFYGTFEVVRRRDGTGDRPGTGPSDVAADPLGRRHVHVHPVRGDPTSGRRSRSPSDPTGRLRRSSSRTPTSAPECT